ncbi:MAG: HEAT repeat domain-containing protein [Candidatus Acidiferrales bacterium]
MQLEMSEKNPAQPCAEIEPALVLLAAGELNPAEQADVAGHLAHCPRCTQAFEQQQEMLALLAEHRAEPDAALLASCRAALEDALDREEDRGSLRRLVGAILPSGWLAPRPAWSAAILLLMGFSVGMLAPRMLHQPVAASPGLTATATATTPTNTTENPAEPASPSIDLHSAQVAGINVLPTGENEPPQVEVRLRAQLPVNVRGTVNNDEVKSVLINVLRNNERFDPDDRLIAVDLLRARNNDSEVRSALCYAVHTDHNAAVRLKALEALNGAEPQDIIRQTLLDALVDDQNPGVRVEAINALRGMAAKGQVVSDDHMLAVLHERMKKDPNTYIRIQSAAAIRDLGPREKF